MYSLEEMATWTPEEVLSHITQNLPKSWTVDYGWDTEARRFQCRFLDGEEKTKWFDEGVDLKILFLDALGWLMLRDKKPQHPAWQRRGEIDPRQIGTPSATSPRPRTPDPEPEDLDPEEVAAVYSTLGEDET